MVYNVLHQLLEQSKFVEALTLLKSDPSSQNLTEGVHNSNLPLHISLIVGAPDDLILQLIQLNEDAVQWKGAESDLPLHIATKQNASMDIVELLIRVYPKGLDARNGKGLTPREIGHSDITVRRIILRPTMCWQELLDDEEREERQDTKLHSFHEKMDNALESLSLSASNMSKIIARLESIDEKLQKIELGKANEIDVTLVNLETTIIHKFEKTENELCMVEDDIKALEIKEYMSKIACEASSTEVRKMQKIANKSSDNFLNEVNNLKISLLNE